MKTDNIQGLQQSPVHLLHRAVQAAQDIFSSEMNVDGLTSRQLVVLMTVAKNEGANQSNFCKRTGIDRTTMAEIVLRLKNRGLLQRRRSPTDQRAYMIRLTDRGREVLRKAIPLSKKIDQQVLGALPQEDREPFIGALQTMVAILQNSSPQDGSPIVR